ncbi:MAG: glycosyltransferase family 2 protein [Lachnospiraceae bacterium]|nr:glycosyltransferase family 2 protein [Lachnospiraceae bacterium]
MKSTVIIPNYNGMKFIENCMKALAKETSTSYHICVVDNGSEDGSREWVEKNCPRVQVIALGENTGFCGAVNAGIAATKTPYVILLNNDTEVEYGFVKALETALEREEKSFSVSAKMVDLYNKEVLDGAGDLYCALGWAFARGKGKSVNDNYTKAEEVFSACGGAVIYKKEILDKIGTFDENHFAYLEDCDLGYRAQIFGYRNYYTPDAVVYHAGSGVSGSRYNDFKVSLASKNSIYLIYKNMPLLQIVLNLPILIPGFLIKYIFFIKKGLGHTYRKGILKGVQLCNSKEGKIKKIPFKWNNLGNYCRIQWKLWINIIRRFVA